MPYVNINVTQPLSAEKKTELKHGIAGIIGILPGKTEQVTMVDVEDGKTLFLNGMLLDNGAYIDVRVYGKCDFSKKDEFTRALFALFESLLGIRQDDMYVSILEFDTWGTRGALK